MYKLLVVVVIALIQPKLVLWYKHVVEMKVAVVIALALWQYHNWYSSSIWPVWGFVRSCWWNRWWPSPWVGRWCCRCPPDPRKTGDGKHWLPPQPAGPAACIQKSGRSIRGGGPTHSRTPKPAAGQEDKTEVNTVHSHRNLDQSDWHRFISYLSVDSDELPGIALGPRWQDDITQLGAILLGAWDIKQRADRTLIFMHSIILVSLTLTFMMLSKTDPGRSCWSLAWTRAGRKTLGWAPWRRPCCVWMQRARLHAHCGTSCQPGQNDLPGNHNDTGRRFEKHEIITFWKS